MVSVSVCLRERASDERPNRYGQCVSVNGL